MPQVRPLPLVLALALTFGTVQPAFTADGVAGPYLAGRIASRVSDYDVAAEYFNRALLSDPNDAGLLENAMIAQIGRGAIDKALPMAQRLDDAGMSSQIGDLVILAALVRNGQFEAALDELDGGRTGGPLVDGLFRAWSLVGMGRMADATAAFDAVASNEGSRAFGLYHKALALAAVGDFEGADYIFSGEADGPLRATRRGVIAHAQILSQLERNGDAVELIDAIYAETGDPSFFALREELAAGKPVSFTVIRNPTDGLAEVFYTVASALNTEAADVNTLAFARLAEYLAPDQSESVLLCASILEAQGQFALANEAFNRISRNDPAYVAAELGRADALIAGDKADAAIEVLQQLSRDHADRSDIWAALGDTLRRQERFGEAADAYDKAVALFTEEDPAQWVIYYTRGIAYEREKEWPKAEADFRKALALNPDHPSVLNYLGYSYLEMNTNLDEAMAMIERALAGRPDSGAITDSLGWALYRLDRYDEAVGHMENAVELMPLDAVINDHLGDVYWAVGRKREAEFQWKRALSLEPATEEEAQRIRRKLEVGLDLVLKEEGAEPLKFTKNGQ
ncbi:tetratricopeptide repeat protein [Defluviimonas salinarum]|uniref:Tetratricopeptide repeat protein n=1 Tax=Defluviimonas salinarum TaxID=2992147 RepID=A0ABT3IZ74_9RHOB|nr:tetratricopeptide repeat protein [Defluviimonas salinarum]